MSTRNSPLLLNLEDDTGLSGATRRLAELAGWHYVSAGSVEAAVREAQAYHASVRLLLVDLMVPATESDRKELERIVTQRKSYQEERVRGRRLQALSEEELIDHRQCLRAFDLKIKSFVAIEGGYDFLRQVASEGLLGKCSVAIHSAKTPAGPEDWADIRQAIGEANWRGWLQKPVDSEEMLGLFCREFSAHSSL